MPQQDKSFALAPKGFACRTRGIPAGGWQAGLPFPGRRQQGGRAWDGGPRTTGRQPPRTAAVAAASSAYFHGPQGGYGNNEREDRT